MSYPNYGYGVGLRNVGSYQVSGHPYITGSADMGSADTEHKISFPYVTKNITLIASGSDPLIKVHFNSDSNGDVLAGNHFITLNSVEDSITFDVKCKEIYISGSGITFRLMAELTGIEAKEMFTLTGSGITE